MTRVLRVCGQVIGLVIAVVSLAAIPVILIAAVLMRDPSYAILAALPVALLCAAAQILAAAEDLK